MPNIQIYLNARKNMERQRESVIDPGISAERAAAVEAKWQDFMEWTITEESVPDPLIPLDIVDNKAVADSPVVQTEVKCSNN